jgi:hypothetical protein
MTQELGPSAAPRVVRPLYPPPAATRAGNLVFLALSLWMGVWLLAAYMTASMEQSAGSPGPLISMCLAVAGGFIGCIILFGWRLPGIRRLWAAPAPLAVITEDRLVLHVPSVGIRAFDWDEIGSLTRGSKGSGVLRSTTGDALMSIPPSIMNGNLHGLAQVVAGVRGDRYEAVRAARIGPRRYLALRESRAASPAHR